MTDEAPPLTFDEAARVGLGLVLAAATVPGYSQFIMAARESFVRKILELNHEALDAPCIIRSVN